ncbi:hypothetical protein AVEN_55513-1 [Araneus ventricosus]|uniref:Uncharacterized protein n=1 Tax=Araneus ventricosus TaxID=182803 RepID=A0A4Y2CA04_ARAVE|nr:hypothetical protein AVEN_55513-1 [Araneus ventricosus]
MGCTADMTHDDLLQIRGGGAILRRLSRGILNAQKGLNGPRLAFAIRKLYNDEDLDTLISARSFVRFPQGNLWTKGSPSETVTHGYSFAAHRTGKVLIS